MTEGTAYNYTGHFGQFFMFHDNQIVQLSDLFIVQTYLIADEIAKKKYQVRVRVFFNDAVHGDSPIRS
jgi:hypothetical protein